MGRYINLNKFLEAVNYEHDVKQHQMWDICDIKELALELATADVVEVKHGHWIVHTFSNNKKFIECSICNAVIDCSKGFIDEDEYDYCPYCCAIMKEGAENG